MPLLLLPLVALAAALAVACARDAPARPPGVLASTPGIGAPSPTSEARATETPGSPTATPTVAPTVTPAATSSATPVVTASPAPGTPAAVPPAAAAPRPAPAYDVQVDPPFVARGETMLVRVIGPAEGKVRAAGQTYPLFPVAGGDAWAVIGVGLYSALGPASLTVSTPAGEVTAAYHIVDPGRPADYLVLTEEQASVLTPEAAARETALRGEQFASSDPAPRWRTAFRHPLRVLEVTTLFGSGRSINGGPVGDFHSGEDLAADEGTPVTAAAPGRVSWAGAMPIRGNSVIVDHGGGVKTGYHHLRDTSVAVGQEIEAGALVGHVGSTGLSTGPHLHWELTILGVNVDPETWTVRGFPR